MNFNNSNSPLTGAFYTCTHKWATDCVYREAGVTREKRSREVARRDKRARVSWLACLANLVVGALRRKNRRLPRCLG